jgi:L-threonylcarbamoyladenylate synthase
MQVRTRVLPTSSPSETRAACEEAAALLRQGKIVSFPTDTFYALGANALDEEAIAQVYRLKGRQASKPILILLEDAGKAQQWVLDISPAARLLMGCFWPGPLTLVFRAASSLPTALTGEDGTVGVRVPSHPLTRALVGLAGGPITGTSANPSGSPAPSSAADVLRYFEGKLPLVVDGGGSGCKAGSTVVSVVHPEPHLLRAGEIAHEAILRALRASSL